MDQLVKEATGIRLRLNNINKGECCKVSHAWNPNISISNLCVTKTDKTTTIILQVKQQGTSAR
jgi:hypothetical protein